MSALREIYDAAITEVREAAKRPALLVTGLLWPVIIACIFASIFAAGLMRNMPVAVVDLDNSVLSREVVTTLESIPSVDLKRYKSVSEAVRDMRAGRVYAGVVIPTDWGAHLAARTGESAIELSFAKSYYAIATTLEIDIKSALKQKLFEMLSPYLAGTAGSLKGAQGAISSLTADIYVPGNSNFNYAPFLLSTLVPCVFALGIVLTMVGVFAREWREKTVTQVFESTSSVRLKLIGKALPWVLFYSFCAAGYVAWFAGFCENPPAGSVLIWLLGGVLLILSMTAFALSFVACSPFWLIAMSCAIAFCAPIIPFTGFSFPLDSMDAVAQLFGELLPLTWFFRVQASQWVLGSPASHTLWLLAVQSLFILVPLTVGLIVFPLRVKRWIGEEARAEPVSDKPLPTTLLGRIFEGVRRGIFTPDTCIIFVLALALYCFFYAWPYMHQTVTGIECAVVDLDRTPASREILSRFRSLPTLKIVAEETDFSKALDLYQREKVSTVITIPVDYEKHTLAGKPVTIPVTVNGFYVVKARAVQAAVLSVTLDEARMPLARSLNRAGTSVERLQLLSNPPIVLADQNLFNAIAGYASYTVPVVGPVIMQSVLFMCIGVTLGGWLARQPTDTYTRQILTDRKTFALCMTGFFVFGLFWFCYAEGFVFSLFEFPTMENFGATLFEMLLMLLGVVGLGAVITLSFGSSAYYSQFVVPTSAPAVFLSGVIYPTLCFGPLAHAVSFFFPTTPGIQAMVALSQNGAALSDVLPHVAHSIVLAVLYLGLADVLRRHVAKRKGLLT